MNSEFFKDLKKNLDKEPINQELSPGTTGRRYIPEGGIRKHNERIHRESKLADKYGNLPFTFSKPSKPPKTKYVECEVCGHITRAQKNTVGMICSNCKKYVSVKEVNMDG